MSISIDFTMKGKGSMATSHRKRYAIMVFDVICSSTRQSCMSLPLERILMSYVSWMSPAVTSQLDMEDGDTIDAFLTMHGGKMS